MAGLLMVEGTRFCVEDGERHIQVFWDPAAPEAAAKARRWFEEALPKQAQVPEHMLRSLMGSRAESSVPSSEMKRRSSGSEGFSTADRLSWSTSAIGRSPRTNTMKASKP